MKKIKEVLLYLWQLPQNLLGLLFLLHQRKGGGVHSSYGKYGGNSCIYYRRTILRTIMNGKIAAILLGIMSACTIVEVLDIAEVETPTPMMQMQKDTTARDTTEIKDTIRIPICFDVVVEDWEEDEVHIGVEKEE